MPARFFVENDLALGKALAELHGNVVFPGHPDLREVPRQSLDDEWLEVVGTKRVSSSSATSESVIGPSKSGCGSNIGCGASS